MSSLFKFRNYYMSFFKERNRNKGFFKKIKRIREQVSNVMAGKFEVVKDEGSDG